MQRIIIIVAVLYLLWRVLTAMGRRSVASGKGAEDFSRFNARSRDRRRAAKERQATNVELIACAHVRYRMVLPEGYGVHRCFYNLANLDGKWGIVNAVDRGLQVSPEA